VGMRSTAATNSLESSGVSKCMALQSQEKVRDTILQQVLWRPLKLGVPRESPNVIIH